uniref:Photosystem II reaction center protein Z n=1 Tax=Haraldiophyllum bonnemaisonii TaxID=167977 RepID=A0A4D6WTC6_9FLOR|nr:photosystem II protein Z [Haraldiophyllum bonnemaisonii]
MILVVQLLALALVLFSVALVISIPVVIASPGEWEKSKNLIYTGVIIWSSLVIITGIANSFIA